MVLPEYVYLTKNTYKRDSSIVEYKKSNEAVSAIFSTAKKD